MSYTLRGQRVAYSNIAVGSATGKERTILGNAGSTQKYGGGSNVSVASTEPTTDFARDRMLTSSGDKTSQYPNENIV